MQPLIAVDDKMGSVKRALQDSGYDVQDLSRGWEHAAAIVISGLDEDFLGIQDIVSKAPVIDASGKDVNEVVADVERVVRLQG
ncbi:MAG: YkuS family protein [Firmicutes bacterium]|nr:YkuS family protein [Bacillota bacterium]